MIFLSKDVLFRFLFINWTKRGLWSFLLLLHPLFRMMTLFQPCWPPGTTWLSDYPVCPHDTLICSTQLDSCRVGWAPKGSPWALQSFPNVLVNGWRDKQIFHSQGQAAWWKYCLGRVAGRDLLPCSGGSTGHWQVTLCFSQSHRCTFRMYLWVVLSNTGQKYLKAMEAERMFFQGCWSPLAKMGPQLLLYTCLDLPKFRIENKEFTVNLIKSAQKWSPRAWSKMYD